MNKSPGGLGSSMGQLSPKMSVDYLFASASEKLENISLSALDISKEHFQGKKVTVVRFLSESNRTHPTYYVANEIRKVFPKCMNRSRALNRLNPPRRLVLKSKNVIEQMQSKLKGRLHAQSLSRGVVLWSEAVAKSAVENNKRLLEDDDSDCDEASEEWPAPKKARIEVPSDSEDETDVSQEEVRRIVMKGFELLEKSMKK